MDKMRILIISDAWKPQVNGVVRTYEDLNGWLEQAGHTVGVIGPADFPWRRPMPGYHEIELVPFPSRLLRGKIDAFKPDTIHIATEGPLGWATRNLCLKRGWPFTTAYHTHFPDYAALRAARMIPALHDPVKAMSIAMMKKFHKPSSAVMTSTASVEKTLTDWGFTAPLHRLTRGVNTDVFHLGPKTLFNDLAGPIALYVGRVAIEKNIEAFLSMPWPGTKVIVGDGPSLPALREKYKDAIFAGVQKGQNLADHFRSADVFVFPSRTDTFGIVLIEAMACGLPIAGYPVTGPMDIVENQALGALSEDLGQAAMAALNAPSSRETRHNHLLTHYTWPLARDQFVDAQSKAMIPR